MNRPGVSGDSIACETMELIAMSRGPHYPAELRERAVRMVAELRPNYPTEYAAMGAVAQKLGIRTTETLRKWVRQAQADDGSRAGTTSEEHAEIKRLKREVAELRRANEILKAASSFFAAELDRPQRFS
jgi:transposase